MALPRALAILAVAASLASTVLAEEAKTCGTAEYFPSEYMCYNNNTLCPIMYSLPSVPCNATGGCYAKEEFSCGTGGLTELPAATGPFTMTAHGTRFNYQNLTVKACGGYIAVGANARECSTCVSGVDCSGYLNQTAFLANGQMAVDVPGSQYWYVDPLQGGLQYTLANSSTTDIQAIAGANVTVHENGFFVYEGMGEEHYWLACLRTLPGGVPGTGKVFRIFAPTFDNLERGDCEPVRLVAKAVEKKGAYKYV